MKNTQVKNKEFKSFYKVVGGNEGDKCYYPARLDMYGCGCAHDCSYCYSKSLLDFRGLWHPEEPSAASIERIAKKIPKIDGVVRLGGMTDCFQPLEKTLEITYQTLKLMKEHGKPYLIVTKSDLVAHDKYIDVLDRDLAHIQITVTFADDKVYKKYEKAVEPSKRMKAIERLYKKGFDVAIRLSPYIPQFVDLKVINSVKVKKAVVEFLRVNHWIKKWFDIDLSDYTLKESGYSHLPLDKKLKYLKKIKLPEITVCDDVDEHYMYFKNNYNPNPDDCCNLDGCVLGAMK